MTTENKDYLEGIIALATAEIRVREISHLADRSHTELGRVKSTLPYEGCVDAAEIDELRKAAMELMFKADELASKINAMREEAGA